MFQVDFVQRIFCTNNNLNPGQSTCSMYALSTVDFLQRILNHPLTVEDDGTHTLAGFSLRHKNVGPQRFLASPNIAAFTEQMKRFMTAQGDFVCN